MLWGGGNIAQRFLMLSTLTLSKNTLVLTAVTMDVKCRTRWSLHVHVSIGLSSMCPLTLLMCTYLLSGLCLLALHVFVGWSSFISVLISPPTTDLVGALLGHFS